MSAEYEQGVEFQNSSESKRYINNYTNILLDVKKKQTYLEAVNYIYSLRDTLIIPSSEIHFLTSDKETQLRTRNAYSFYRSLSPNMEITTSISKIQREIEANKRMCIEVLSPSGATIKQARENIKYNRITNVTALYVSFIDMLNIDIDHDTDSSDFITKMTRGEVIASVLRTLSKGEIVSTLSELKGKETTDDEQKLKSIEEFTGAVATKGEIYQEMHTLANIYVGLEEAQRQFSNSKYARMHTMIKTWRDEISANATSDPDFGTFALASSQAETALTHLSFVHTGALIQPDDFPKGLELGLKNKFGLVTRQEAIAYIQKMHSKLIRNDLGLDQEGIEAMWRYLDTIGSWTLGQADYDVAKERLRIKNEQTEPQQKDTKTRRVSFLGRRKS